MVVHRDQVQGKYTGVYSGGKKPQLRMQYFGDTYRLPRLGLARGEVRWKMEGTSPFSARTRRAVL